VDPFAEPLLGGEPAEQGDELLALGGLEALAELPLVLHGDLHDLAEQPPAAGEVQGSHATIVGVGPSPEQVARQILDALAGGERPVNDLVGLLGLAQPLVSKHLRVLREVGAVDVRDEGRQRLYRLNGHALKPIHDWVKRYERSWTERFDRLDVVLEDLKRKEKGDGAGDE